jgi:hypothetical protein
MNPVFFLVALAASAPNVDLQRICQGARSAALPEDRASAFDSCMHDEQAARDQLQQKWTQFPSAARDTCALPQAVMTSYVEMLTCLEMQNGGDFGAGKQPADVPAISPPTQPATPDAVAPKQ